MKVLELYANGSNKVKKPRTAASEYANRILSFDSDCAQVWGRLMSPQASHPIDKQIAAIALIHGLDVVTRDVHDFSATGVKLLNPFV